MRHSAVLATTIGAAVFAATGALAHTDTVQTESGTVVVENLADGLDHPWGMAFLPDGRILITERAGNLRLFGTDGELSEPLQGTPEALARGQGGLLDVALDPDFESNRLVYLSFAERGDGGASTAVGRGRLQDNRIEDFEVLFRQAPKVSGSSHFGGRIAFSSKGHLFLTLGDRNKLDPAQNLSDHLGTIVRIHRDGSIPDSNPFAGREDAEDEIWSYGHRNIESADIHPETGALWIAEMGPSGGDELNSPEAGHNHGWPVVSWGRHYDGTEIPDPPTEPRYTDAVHQWTPVISPSGMAFYTGDVFPEWRGSMLIGGLSAEGIVRVELDGRNVTGEERIPLDARIRDVAQGLDGFVYVLTDQDNGNLWRLKPQQVNQ